MRLEAHITSDGDLPRMAQQLSVISGTSARASISGNSTSDRDRWRPPASRGRDQRRVAGARVRLALAPAGAPRKRHGEALARQPIDPFERLVEGAGTALFFMQRLGVVIEADAQRRLAAIGIAQAREPVANARAQHGLHGVGQHEDREAAGERVLDHAENVRVHERLAAGEADLGHRPAIARDLVEIRGLPPHA